MPEDKPAKMPIGAFDTMRKAFDAFGEGVPHRIDRSAFPGLAWNVQSRLLNGMQFLGLIDAHGQPSDSLHAVAVRDEAKRKVELAKVLRDRYAELFKLDLMRVTPAHLSDTMGSAYNVAGDTRDKAVRFFLNAVMYVGMPVSSMLQKRVRKSTGLRIRRSKQNAKANTSVSSATAIPTTTATVAETSGTSRVIQLSSGGTLTLSASIDLFKLNPSDRKFVFELIDKLDAYERTGGSQ
jgi:hypothetical protein